MLTLSGETLGDKHREFNQKVIKATGNKSLYDDVNKYEESDGYIDNLFKIDVASGNKDLDYIIKMLKSGNNLYVTRALKFPWIYDDTYTDIIHPTYLHYHIFPYMSERMKKKMLTTISVHVRNEDRVICFYTYCIKIKLQDLALKFLMYTPEYFKMQLIEGDDYFYYFDDAKRLKFFIGNSISLAVAYIEMHDNKDRPNVIHELRFLYFMSNKDYLDILEKYDTRVDMEPNSLSRLGIRISRDILKRHKHRVWEHPVYYINKLNTNMLLQYFSSEDVKKIAVLLLPNKSSQFWSMDFYHSYKFILDVVPPTERFAHLKELFSSKYEGETFEMNIKFYNLNYFEMFTVEEREAWALHHIEREEELLGSGNDYIWYKFVSFDKAFTKIKRYIFLTPDNEKRSKIVNILVDTIRLQEDLKKLLNYYYERHVNESEEHKMSFLDAIVTKHDVYAFDTECWTPLNSLFYSLEVYTMRTTNWKFNEYVMRTMIYYILNKKEFSDDLNEFIHNEQNFRPFCDIISELSEERCYVVIQYWVNYYVNNIQRLLDKPLDKNAKDDIREEISLVWNVIWCFKRDEKECPKLVLTYMNSNLDIYKDHPALREKFVPMTEGDFVRLLKCDVQKAIESVSKVQCNTYRWPFRLTRFFRKVKVYFPGDVAGAYLKYFLESFDLLKAAPFYIRIYRNIKMAVVGIFLLGDEKLKISLLEKYVPENKKIEYGEIDGFLLQMQKAICRLAYLSKPAVPLSNILKYITGDYIRFCIPIFHNYIVNLPMTEAFNFIYEIIDSPVSIQKHGLRMAFKCFNLHDLTKVILNVWKKTDNVSLRTILYKTLFSKMVNEEGYLQKEFYEVLKIYTADLNDQDHEDVFNLLTSDDMPENFRGDYIETAWEIVSKFSDKKTNIVRKTSLIRHIKKNLYSLSRQFVRQRIINDHVQTVLYKNRLALNYDTKEEGDLLEAKWHLTAVYIVTTRVQGWKDPSLELARDILKKCLQMWNNKDKDVYVTRQFYSNFLDTFHDESCVDIGPYLNVIQIYRCILAEFSKSLSQNELYLLTWKLKLHIKSRRVIYLHYMAHNKCSTFPYPCVVEIADAFAKKIGKIVKQLVDRNKFYCSLYYELAHTVKYVCGVMARVMNVNSNGFKILVSGHLAQFKINETYALAVKIMPKVSAQKWKKRHENVLKILKQYENDEIRNNLAHKFVFAM